MAYWIVWHEENKFKKTCLSPDRTPILDIGNILGEVIIRDIFNEVQHLAPPSFTSTISWVLCSRQSSRKTSTDENTRQPLPLGKESYRRMRQTRDSLNNTVTWSTRETIMVSQTTYHTCGLSTPHHPKIHTVPFFKLFLNSVIKHQIWQLMLILKGTPWEFSKSLNNLFTCV